MNNQYKRYWDKLIFSIIALVVIGWMIFDHSKSERELYEKNLEYEVDLVSSRVNQLVQTNRVMLTLATGHVETALSQENGLPLATQQLEYMVDRVNYKYSLFVEPNNIINGIDTIDPRMLMKQGYKKYGEVVYFGDPFFDGERKTLYFPIYTKLNEKKISNKGMVYKEIDASILVRDLTRMNINRGGQGYLIDKNSKVTNLSLNSSVSSSETKVIHRLVEEGKFRNNQLFSYNGHLITTRLINSTEWQIVYIQKDKNVLEKETGNLFFIGVIVLLVFLVGVIDMRKITKAEKEMIAIHKSGEERNLKNEHPYYEWLKHESEQIKYLNTNNYSDEILRFKVNHCLVLLSNSSEVMPTYSSKEFLNWAKEHFEQNFTKISIEDYSDSGTVSMSPMLLQASISLVRFLMDSELGGSVQLKGDVENQLLIFNCFGDISKLAIEIASLKEMTTSYDNLKDDVRITSIGNRIILSMNHKQIHEMGKSSYVQEPILYPKLVYFYENEAEQSAILKFYLDYLKMPYEVITSLKAVPADSVVLITESVYMSITEADQIGVDLPYRFIVCGDFDSAQCAEAITISRPYALEKLEFALQRVSKKKIDA